MITNRIDDRWPDFHDYEMRCHCGCQRIAMDVETLDMLQEIRTLTGIPMHVSSGYRCPEYNMRVSYTGMAGPHVLGLAVDTRMFGESVYILVHTAMDAGFTGVGLHQVGDYDSRFFHLDTVITGFRPRIWTYDRDR